MYTQPAHLSTNHYTIAKQIMSLAKGRTKKEYSITAKALDYGHLSLSPAVIRTYRVLYDLDFADSATKLCKGYLWYSTERLAQCIGCSSRTVQRHITALEKAGLAVRQRVRNMPSLVCLNVIEGKGKIDVPIVDKLYPQTTKLSFPYRGTKETIGKNINTIQYFVAKIQRYEAQCDGVVTHLISLGYTPRQAVNDFLQFGGEELQQQIDNLYTYLRHGKTFGSYARWLYWAIRAGHRVNLAELPTQHTMADRPPVEEEAGEWVSIESDDPYEANTLHWRPKTKTPELPLPADMLPVDLPDFHSSFHEVPEDAQPKTVVVYEPNPLPISIPIPIHQISRIDIWKDQKFYRTLMPPLRLCRYHSNSLTTPVPLRVLRTAVVRETATRRRGAMKKKDDERMRGIEGSG